MRCAIFNAGPPITTAASLPSVSWSCSPPKPAMPGCSTPPSRRRERSDPHRGTDTTFAIGWNGRYRLEGPVFIYTDQDTGRVATILGYPTDKLSQIG